MIKIIIFLLFFTSLFASSVETLHWSNGETYLSFLERNKLPLKSLYYNLDKDEQQLSEEIVTDVRYHILRGTRGEIEQILIPIGDEIQMHIYKKDSEYYFEAIPVIAQTKIETFVLKIDSSLYEDILAATGSVKLAYLFVSSFKQTLNFKNTLKKGDTIAMTYQQKYRLAKPFDQPSLKVAMISSGGKEQFIYVGADERIYDASGQELGAGFLLSTPVRGARISSGFSKSRFHPILRKYRAHLGMDYAASGGTPIVSSGDGRVVFQGFTRGYGNVTKIQHANNYLTLYAHQKSFRKGVKRGSSVKKGQVIGYVGSTGLSTGAHLHFGLYKGGVAMDPKRVIQVATQKLSGKARANFLALKSKYDKNLKRHIKAGTKPQRLAYTDNSCYFFTTGD